MSGYQLLVNILGYLGKQRLTTQQSASFGYIVQWFWSMSAMDLVGFMAIAGNC